MTTTTIYDLSATSNRGEEIDFAQFAGRPMLLVNTANQERNLQSTDYSLELSK